MTRQLIKGIKLKNRRGIDAAELAEEIEKGLVAIGTRPPQSFVQKKTFSPSTIGYGHGNCPRFWYLAFTGTENWQDTFDSMGLANMDLGSMVHEQIQKSMEIQGLMVESEVEVKLEDPPIRGYLDAVLNWKGEEVVGEIKTTRSDTFAFREATGKPSVNHLIQLLIYMRATGRQWGFFLYVNKNDSTFLVIPVEMNEENAKILDDVLEWLRTVRAAYDNQTLPFIPFVRARNSGEPSNNICRNCPVQQDCFSNPQSGDVMLPVMELPKI